MFLKISTYKVAGCTFLLRNTILMPALILTMLCLLPACQGDRIASEGDTASIHYTGTLDDGTEFDSSKERGPLQFKLGDGAVIPGFEQAVLGLKVGESKKVRLEAKDAYGEPRKELIFEVTSEGAPDDLKVGRIVPFNNTIGTVTKITDERITVDAYHPLAGKALTFEIELVSLRSD